jgi:hypothetical protein
MCRCCILHAVVSNHHPHPPITTPSSGRFVNLLSVEILATGLASQTEVLIPRKLGAYSHDTIRSRQPSVSRHLPYPLAPQTRLIRV